MEHHFWDEFDLIRKNTSRTTAQLRPAERTPFAHVLRGRCDSFLDDEHQLSFQSTTRNGASGARDPDAIGQSPTR